MNRIIKVSEEKVIIGTEKGGIIEVSRDNLDFEPTIGKMVDVFTSETDVYICEVEKTQPNEGLIDEEQGLNINIKNENASNNTGVNSSGIRLKVVNKLVYILLAIFLGGIGIHKFYSGRTGLGVLYILFCWTVIPAVIGVIEGIIVIFKTADENGNIVI